jgi:hypothetical protein
VNVTTVARTGVGWTLGYVRVVEAKEYPQADLQTPKGFRSAPIEDDEDDEDGEEDVEEEEEVVDPDEEVVEE